MVAGPEVFISYAHDSARLHAEALHASLLQGGVPAFLDTASLAHGESIPGHVFDALLGARVLVAFCDPTYFTRRYCVEELGTALAAYRSLDRRGGPPADLAEALLPLVIALAPDARRAAELAQLPPEVRATLWPVSGDTGSLSALVGRRLDLVRTTFGQRLDRLGERDQVEGRLREVMAIPAPRGPGPGLRYRESGLPPSIGDLFVGRARELWDVHTALASRQTGAVALATVLEGGGGFGKTRLALEYLHRYAGTYPGGIFWLDADVSPDRLESQLHGVLSTLRPGTPGVPQFKEAGRDLGREVAAALEERSTTGRVLYVVDNVPEPEGDGPPDRLERYCPARSHVSLLVTSRARQTLPPGLERVLVRELPEESAVRLLTAGVEDRHTIFDQGWLDIATWVGRLPLALELLNAMLRAGGISPMELLEAQRERRPTSEIDRGMEVLRHVVEPGTLRGVTEALEVSHRRLPDDARLAAHVLAWLAPDPVPRLLLADEAVFTPKVLAVLRARSFVTEVHSDSVVLYGRVHRVLADFLRGTSAGRAAELRHARAGLRQVMTVDFSEPVNWPLLRACWPHVESGLGRGLDLAPDDPDSGPTLALVVLTAAFLVSIGQVSATLSWVERIAEETRGALGDEHAATGALRLLLAQLRAAGGGLSEASDEVDAVLPGLEAQLGDEHEAVMAAKLRRASLLLAQEEPAGARALLEELLPACRRTRSGRTVIVEVLLALALRELGDPGSADAVLGNALETARAAAMDEHNLLGAYVGEQAVARLRHGRAAQVGEQLEWLVDRCRHVLGDSHVITLAMVSLLAAALHERGDRTAARELTARVSEAMLGARNPDSLYEAGSLAITLEAGGGWATLIGGRTRSRPPLDDRRRRLDEARRRLGGRHPDTLRAATGLAGALIVSGDLMEARDLMEDALDAGGQVLGTDHPDVLAMTAHLAGALHGLGERERATELKVRVVEARRRNLGPDHRDTILAISSLAASLDDLGSYDEALGILEQAREASARVRGEEDPDTVGLTLQLLVVAWRSGDHERASSLYDRLMETSPVLRGGEHFMGWLLMATQSGLLRMRGSSHRAR